jgi:kynurenine formamidase
MKYKPYAKSFIFRFADNTYEASEHVGTHIDAPFHMVEDGWKVGDIPLQRFFVPGQSPMEKKIPNFLNKLAHT